MKKTGFGGVPEGTTVLFGQDLSDGPDLHDACGSDIRKGPSTFVHSITGKDFLFSFNAGRQCREKDKSWPPVMLCAEVEG